MKRAAGRRQIEPVISDVPDQVGCTGKRCYDQPAAVKLAKRMRRNHDDKVEGYHCTHCHAWHIGSTRPKLKALIERTGKRHDQAGCDQ